jgi:hypothetical protein
MTYGVALFETSFVICSHISQMQSPGLNLADKATHNVDTLVAGDTNLGALRAQVDTNDTHGRGLLEQETAESSARLRGRDRWTNVMALAGPEIAVDVCVVEITDLTYFQEICGEASNGALKLPPTWRTFWIGLVGRLLGLVPSSTTWRNHGSVMRYNQVT